MRGNRELREKFVFLAHRDKINRELLYVMTKNITKEAKPADLTIV